jgi:hypothetical protein
MSRIRANKITNKIGTGAVELEKGAHLPIGMGITGAGGLNITGVITATSFSGSGANLTGIDATSIKDSGGNVKVQAQASGAVYTGIHTFNSDIDVDGHTNLDNINVAGVATFASAVNTGALTASTGSFSGNVSIGGTLTYEDVTNIDSVGLITAREGIRLADDKKIILGTGGDFEIYHDTSSRSGVRFTNPEFRLMAAGGTGNIQFGVSNSATELSYSALMAEFKKGAECTLNFNGSPKLATSNTGITVTGTVAATAYTGDGSGLSGITVGITTEALVKTNGQTASLDLTKDDHKVTATGTVTIDVTGGTEAGSHTLRIVNSGIATVGFSTYFLFPSGGTPSLPTASGAISLISFTVHRAGAVGVSTQLISGASVNFS